MTPEQENDLTQRRRPERRRSAPVNEERTPCPANVPVEAHAGTRRTSAIVTVPR